MRHNPDFNHLPNASAQQPLFVERLIASLESANKLHWCATVTFWLSRFQGIEGFFRFLEETPQGGVLRLGKALSGTNLTDTAFADRLSRLDFLTLRARRGDRFWDFREDPFTTFYVDGSTSVWRSDKEFPESTDIAEWLTATLKRLSPAPGSPLIFMVS